MASFTRQTTRRLGEILLEEKLVTVPQLQQALKRQYMTGELLGEALVKLNIVTESDIARVISRQFGYPYFDASRYDIPAEVLPLVPVDIALEYQLIPLDKIGKILLVAAAGVVPAEVLDAIARRSTLQIFLCISTAGQILESLKKNGSRLLETIKHNYETKTN